MTINSSIIYSKFEKAVITKAAAIENTSQLEIECVAMVAGEFSPCYCPLTGKAIRDPETNNLTLFKYSPELILAYASNFSLENPINFNQDHIEGSFVGKITNLSTKEIEGNLALIAQGIIEEKEWIKKILENKFSGISIETHSNLVDISQSRITAISLLNSLPPACSKSKCKTSILTASSEEEIMKIDNSDLIFTEEEQEFFDNLGIDTKASWNGPSSEKKLLDYSRNKDNDIVVSKIRKYFLIVNSPSGENGKYNREDFKYPVGTIIDGKPDYVLDGLVAALKRSAGEGVDLKSKIRRIIIRRFGIDFLPPSLKTKATLQLLENDGDKMDVIDDKTIEHLPDSNLESTTVETKATQEEIVITEEVKTEIIPPVIETKAAEEPVVEIKTEASQEEITKLAEAVTELKPFPEVLTKAQMEEMVCAELGVESLETAKDMFKELADIKIELSKKSPQWETDGLQRQINELREKNCELQKFKDSVEEKEIMSALPRGVWEGEMDINGEMVPKIKMIAKEIREGGVATFLKYGMKSKASSSEILEGVHEISTKGSLEPTETPLSSDEAAATEKKESVIQAVADFKKRYLSH